MSLRASTPYSHRQRHGCTGIRFDTRAAAERATRRHGGQPAYCPSCCGYHVEPTDTDRRGGAR